MATLRATSFFLGNVSVIGPTNLYTVPAGHRINLRSIVLHNEWSASVGCTIRTVSGMTIAGQVLTAAGTAGATYTSAPNVILNAGETLTAILGLAHTVDIALSGTLLYV